MKKYIYLSLALFTLFGCAAGGSAVKEGSRLESEGRKADALALYEQTDRELGDSTSDNSLYVKGRVQALRKELTDQALAEARRAYGDRPTAASASDAIAILEKNARFDDQDKRIEGTLNNYRGVLKDLKSKQADRLGQADAAASRNEWAESVRLLDEAFLVGPDQKVAQRKQDILKDRDAYYKDRFAKALDKQDWAEAGSTIEKYSAEVPKPDDATIGRYKDELAGLVEKVVFKKADELAAKRKYYRAYLMLKDCKLPAAEKRMEEMKRAGADYYKSAAADDMAKGEGRLAYAYIGVVKGLALMPDDSGLFDLHRDVQDKLEQQLKVQIAVSTFDSPASDQDAGRRFSDELISYLVKRLPYGIEVLERSKIDLLLKESGLELKDVSRQLGAKLFIIGNVNDLNVEHKRYEAKESVEGYTETTENYQYEQVGGKGDGEDEDGDTGKKAKSKTRNAAPSAITKKTPVEIQYTKGYEKVRGSMSLSVRVFDSEKGSIAFAEQFKAFQEVEDKFQEGVNRSHVKVDADPLDLPADSEIKEKIMGEMVDKVAAVVLKLFEQREWRYWENVKYRMDRRELTQAVDEAAKGYLYCVKDGLQDDNEWFSKIRQAALVDLTE